MRALRRADARPRELPCVRIRQTYGRARLGGAGHRPRRWPVRGLWPSCRTPGFALGGRTASPAAGEMPVVRGGDRASTVLVARRKPGSTHVRRAAAVAAGSVQGSRALGLRRRASRLSRTIRSRLGPRACAQPQREPGQPASRLGEERQEPRGGARRMRRPPQAGAALQERGPGVSPPPALPEDPPNRSAGTPGMSPFWEQGPRTESSAGPSEPAARRATLKT